LDCATRGMKEPDPSVVVPIFQEYGLARTSTRRAFRGSDKGKRLVDPSETSSER
jgi:hypothetical protein